MALLVGVRFRSGGKVYHFDPADNRDLDVGDWVVVETARGPEIGEVVQELREVSEENITGQLRPVVRRATAIDTMQKQRYEIRAQEALEQCRSKVDEYGLPMKIVHAEYSFDGSNLIFLFSSEKRVDFRKLVKDLAQVFRARIELRQIGVRDEARLIGGFGRCGRPLCCAAWLSEFSPVSIKMAKNQDLPLSPMEISGVCGRLLCCLAYEHEYYQEMKSKLPKKGHRLETAQGKGIVTGIDLMLGAVIVELEGGETVQITLEELEGGGSESGEGNRDEPKPEPAETVAMKEDQEESSGAKGRRRRKKSRRRNPRRRDRRDTTTDTG